VTDIDLYLTDVAMFVCVGLLLCGAIYLLQSYIRWFEFKTAVFQQLATLDTTLGPAALVKKYEHWIRTRWDNRFFDEHPTYKDRVNAVADELRSFDLQHTWVRSTDYETY